jgi:hypothetical protein
MAIVLALAPSASYGAEVDSNADVPAKAQGGEVATPAPEASEVLTCEGGWRFPLYETRRELGPARLTRLLEIQEDIVLSVRAFSFCRLITGSGSLPESTMALGACEGLLAASRGIERISDKLFHKKSQARSTEACLASGPRPSGQCEHVRQQLTSLRRYQRVGVERAALVASVEVCASGDRRTNSGLRKRCQELEAIVAKQSTQPAKGAGRFSLSAPLPQAVAQAVESVRQSTDSHFLNLVPEDLLGVRQEVCEQSRQVGSKDLWGQRWEKVRHSLCAELTIATNNAETCRQADIYIDERGELHLQTGLTRRDQRKEATLCIDVSDFDGDHPLMITLGLAPASSVPERVWPGETVSVGHWLNTSSRAQDVLQLSVYGKARGVSLKEVLRINGANFTGASQGAANAEACRIARSWVPVVDHEVPIGPKSKQAIIPVDFGRGRDGETTKIEEGDHLFVWVRHIEPAGSVMVEYADGQLVRFEPPPLLGKTENANTSAQKIRHFLRGAHSAVSEPLLPRRARYPGSRVLRLGAPAGGSEYDIRICIRTRGQASAPAKKGSACDVESIIVDEKIYVHGFSRMGLQLHVGYSFFQTPTLAAKRTAAARAAGASLYEVVEESAGRTSQDIAVLLAVYPFGRDPYDFSHKPWSSSYWRHAALLCGFTVRKKNIWEDIYLGASVPLANGISATVLGHFTRRDLPTQTSTGQFLNIPDGGSTVNLDDYLATTQTLSAGIGVGISFDLNLFQKAFSGVWQRISGPQNQFYSSGQGP